MALISTFINFFFDNRKVILLIQCVTLLFYWTHLFLLWWISGAWFLYMQIWRNTFFALKTKRSLQHIWFIVLMWIYVYIYMQNKILDPLAHLTLLWTVLWTIGCWVQNTKLVRLFFFLSTWPWIYYVFQIESIFAIVLQLTFMISILINIIRFDILKKKETIT